MMRIAALAIVLGAAIAATPASAQTYSPDYPVCLHVFGEVTYFDCRYTSIDQCKMTASGRAAECVVNPYIANAGPGSGAPPVRYHHHHRHYRAY